MDNETILAKKSTLQSGDLRFIILSSEEEAALPLYTTHVRAGFPSPAADHIEERITLTSYLSGNLSATFYVLLEGDSMIDFNLLEGDLLVIDRSMEVRNGDIVLANVDNQYTVKLLEITETGARLVPGNKNYPTLEITEDLEMLVWGVVRGVARRFRK